MRNTIVPPAVLKVVAMRSEALRRRDEGQSALPDIVGMVAEAKRRVIR